MNAPENPAKFRLIGTRPVRPDGVDKVTGKAVYSPDFSAAAESLSNSAGLLLRISLRSK